MTVELEKLNGELLMLPPPSRAWLAQKLLASLAETNGEVVEALWLEEIRRRDTEIKMARPNANPPNKYYKKRGNNGDPRFGGSMTREDMLRDFVALPPEGQRVVADLIAFLRQRYAQGPPIESKPETEWSSEEAIGMWRDRAEMSDSTAWVRQLRESEWSK